MVDEIFDRQYQAGRADVNRTILTIAGKLGKSIGDAFKVLNRIEYSAPWTGKPRRPRTH